jgi:hypothetical protein
VRSRGRTPQAGPTTWTRFALPGLLAVLFVGQGACGGNDEPIPDEVPTSSTAGPKGGRWRVARPRRLDGLTEEQRAEIERLESLGYAAGVHEATGLENVTRHDPERAFDGVNLYTSAHAAETRLIDMRGKVLHEWRYPFEKVWPRRALRNEFATYWRRTHLFENGDLLAIYDGLGLIKLDKDSNLIWASEVLAHHDLAVLEDGTIYVLTREARVVPEISPERRILEDFVSELGPEGEERRRISLIEAMNSPEFQGAWTRLRGVLKGHDVFHTNSLEVLDGRLAGRNPAFREGNFLLSMRQPNLVCIVDPEAGGVVWGRVGPHRRQHDPTALDNGRVLIFDNDGGGPQASRVLEMDPATWEVVWSYEGTEEEPFYSATCGLAQRLPNGNTLVTESDYGRAFEITGSGEVVWEFYNPHRTGEGGRYVATLMEMIRLPRGFPLDWARGR